MEAVIIFPLILVVLIILGVIQQQLPEGTYAEREKNPEYNTRDWEQHWRRLKKFGYSKYKTQTYFLGPRGGYYYYSANGNKVYC